MLLKYRTDLPSKCCGQGPGVQTKSASPGGTSALRTWEWSLQTRDLGYFSDFANWVEGVMGWRGLLPWGLCGGDLILVIGWSGNWRGCCLLDWVVKNAVFVIILLIGWKEFFGL